MKIEIDVEIPEGYEATGEYRVPNTNDIVLQSDGSVYQVRTPNYAGSAIILRPVKSHVQQALYAFNTSNYCNSWELISNNEKEFFRHPNSGEYYFALGGETPCEASVDDYEILKNVTDSSSWYGKRLILRRKQRRVEDFTKKELQEYKELLIALIDRAIDG